jgi:hypothetical protein
LTDPKRGRFGYCGEMGDHLLRNQAYAIDLFIPDPTGKRTWVFNDKDPEAAELPPGGTRDGEPGPVGQHQRPPPAGSSGTRSSTPAIAAMIVSFSPHIATEYLTTPEKFGKDKPYGDTVGMAAPPGGPAATAAAPRHQPDRLRPDAHARSTLAGRVRLVQILFSTATCL